MPHDTQCVCQICVCGRHRCPNNRNASSICIGTSNQNTFYKKEYAVITGDNHSKVIRKPEKSSVKDHIDLSDGCMISSVVSESQCAQEGAKFAANENANVAQFHTDAKEKAVNTRMSSSVLRRRNYESSIVFGSDKDNSQPNGGRENNFARERSLRQYSSKYEDPFNGDNKHSVIVGRRKDRSAETRDNVGLILQSIDRSVRQEDETERSHRYNRTKGRYQHSEILSGNKISLPPVYARTEHTAKTNERSGVKRPTKSEIWEDSDISYGDGSFISETQTSTEFTAKKGERYDAKCPVESDLWKREGHIISETVSHQDYVGRTGERYPASKPQDSDVLHGDGSFTSETQTSTEFTAKKGERYDAKRPVESDLWKIDGKFETKSVSRRDFCPKKGERCAIKKPCDTDILFGDGSFRTETHSQEQEKQDESVKNEVVKKCSGSKGCTENLRVADSERVVYDIVDRSRSRTENCWTAYTETFYEGVPAEDVRRVIQHKNHEFKLLESHLEDRTICHTSFNMPEASSKEVLMAPSKLQESVLWQNGQMKVESQYNTDFVPKLKPCPAGELIKSIAKNHSSTEHFEFYRILGGHHFYEPKADDV